MKKLRELCLDYNKLSILPSSIHRLRKLKILRIEGNLLLTDPPGDVIGKGAEGVVAYFHDRVMKDEIWRIRSIVTGFQDLLVQAEERGKLNNIPGLVMELTEFTTQFSDLT